MITVGISNITKEYKISKTNIHRWLIDNKNRQINKHYRQSGTNLTLFKWLSDCLEDSYYELDLDKMIILIDMGFMKFRSDMIIQALR